MANKNDIISKALKGGTQDIGLGKSTVADGLTFEVFIVPKSIEGTPLSNEQLNQLRVGNGLGQHPQVNYGQTSGNKNTKAPKRKAAKAKGAA